ncbi:MAG TPA: hypothetical protein VL403_20230 [Candidatus Kryptonia bacterium]|nr:hypothetical protein [Candidatus Kryptonia bacterium]
MSQAIRRAAQMKNLLGVIWSGMLVAIVTYGAACLVLAGTPGDAAEDAETLRYIFTAVAIVVGGLSMWWRHYFLALEGPATLGAGALRAHSLVVWALSEAVAICGLLLAVLAHTANEFLPFAFAAAALMILHRPSNLPFARLREPTM